MKDVKWPDLTGFGARLVVSPANQYRSKTAMLLVDDLAQFKSTIEKASPNKTFEQILVDAHFFEVQNEENKFAYYYRNSAKSGIDLNDVKKLFPLLSNDNNVLTPQENIYLKQLPFSKNLQKWKSYFSTVTERLAILPEVLISKSKSDLDITNVLQESIVQSNKSYLAQFNGNSIPFNRLQDYGYKEIFSKVYLDEETAICNGELPDNLIKIKLSPFSVPLNFENNGSILILEDLRQIPEIFAYDPVDTLHLQDNIKLVHFAHDYESTFNQVIGHIRGNDLFKMSIQEFDGYVKNLSDDLEVIDQVFYKPGISYPTFNSTIKEQGIPSISKDDTGTWQIETNDTVVRLTDRTFYECLQLRHDFASQLVKQLPNNKVYDSELNESYMQINTSSIIKFNQLYDYQSKIIKQKELESDLNETNVLDILSDLDVDFNASGKENITENDILKIASGNNEVNINNFEVLKELLKLPENLLDDRGNDKVREFAPSMLEIRQVLDVYVIPKAQEIIDKIELEYSNQLNKKYEELQSKIKNAAISGELNPEVINVISDEIEAYSLQISNNYNDVKRILWESEALVSGVTTGTNSFLFNKDSFYYKKDENNQFKKFESEVEVKQYKATLYKLLSSEFDDKIVSVQSTEFQDFIANSTAIEMLLSRVKPYVEEDISKNVSGDFFYNERTESETNTLSTFDLLTKALVNNEKQFAAYFDEFDSFLSNSNFDEVLLNQTLSKIKNYNLLKYGVYDALAQKLITHQSGIKHQRKGDGNSIPDEVFAKTSSYRDGFSIDRHFNRFVEVEAFQKALASHYPNQDWSFITTDPDGKNVQSVVDDMYSDYKEDQKDVSDIHISIERLFYKPNTPLFAVNKELAANEAFVQLKPIGNSNDLTLAIINRDLIDNNIHFSLSNDPFKATLQLYENIANYTVEKLLYLNSGDLDLAKNLASLIISENNVELKKETLNIVGVALDLNDFQNINSLNLVNDSLVLNNKTLFNTNYNNLQIYNLLNLIDINKRTLFGKFDIDVSEDFKAVKDLLRPNTSFQKHINYFSITPQEENVQYTSELDFFDKQLENAVIVYEESNGPISIPNNSISLLAMKKEDIQYLRLFDQNDKSMPYIGQSVSLDANIYKTSGFSDRDAVKISSNVFFKFGNKHNQSTFMPPAKFTFEKYYDSDLNYFKARAENETLTNQIFTSLPAKVFDTIMDNPSIHGTKQNFRSNRHIEIYDKFEDLVFDKKINEAQKLLSEISPSYSYVLAQVDGQTALLPKNLTSIFEIEQSTDIHPFDLFNHNAQQNDLVDIFSKGIDGNSESLIAKTKYRITLGKIGNPGKELLEPRFYTEQNLINVEFASKYKAVKSLDEVDSLFIEHVESLKTTLQAAYLKTFPGSTPSSHNYSLLNKKGIDDVTPQLYLVDRYYEEYLAGELLHVIQPEYSYVNIQGFNEPKEYKFEIINNLKSNANLGTHLEDIALTNLPSHKVIHKNEYMNKQLASLHYQSLITNILGALYDKLGNTKHYISEKNSKLVLGHKPSTDTDYSTFELFKDNQSLKDGFKALCVFPLKALRSVEDVLDVQKIVFSDFNFIDQLVPKVNYEPETSKVQAENTEVTDTTYLGDVGKKFGGAHKDRYGEYISLEYISNTSADQSATDYRKAKIIANKEFQLWYSNTNLTIDDRIFVKAMYDYCPPKPIFSKNALMIESQRANELRAYVAVVSNLKNLMVDTKEDLLSAIKSNRHLTAEGLGFTDRQRRDYIGLYSKGTKHNYKNYFEILSNLNEYYIGPNHTGGISVQLEKILEKTIDKEFSKILSTGKIFDFYGKSKVDKDVSDAISNMQRTGLYSPLLEPYVLKHAIDTGLVKAESDPIYVNEPIEVIKAQQIENIDTDKSIRSPKVPSFTSSIIELETGYTTESISSNVYGLLNYVRTGPNFRKGEDVDAFNLKNTFEISGVEFGNKVAPIAQQLVNAVHDSFNDLKLLMGFKSNEGLLNVGVALASRGIKGSAAHYELSKNVVNLTRDQGAGSLAHEYAHALDAYLGTLEKAEVYKNQSTLSRGILQEYYEDIQNFEIPNARHFLTKMLDAGYSPMTESGRAFEKLYKAMEYQPIEEIKNFGLLSKENAEEAKQHYVNNRDKCVDEVVSHKGVYAETDRRTLNAFFDWHESHYSELINRQFDKVEDYLKKYKDEYKKDDNLSFFRSVQDKVDNIISKINTDINSLSFKSYERFQEKKNDQRQPEFHLPTKGIEDKINKIFTAAQIDISVMSAHLSTYLAEASKFKFYNLIEKYMPEGIKDPHNQMHIFFDKTNSEPKSNLDIVRFSNVISRYKNDCLNHDRHENRSTPYYATSTEMFARYFETYLYSKISASNDISNTFLIDGYPQVMPKGLEFEVCNDLTDKFVQTCVNEIFDKDLIANQDLQLSSQNTKAKDSESLNLTI